jgi:phosphoribosylaminoimidazole-succinocarboxamide synthase
MSEPRPAAHPAPFTGLDLPLSDRREGKVRISYGLDRGHRLFVTTDRLSVFDRVVAAVPFKGQVLNQLSHWWFEQTADIVTNHVVATPDPNVLVAHEVTPLPVEVVVRAHITGVTDTSLWRRYEAGARTIDGHRLPEGLRKNARLPRPIVTPTTKAHDGGHDEPLSPAEVVERGLVDADVWDEVMDAALAVFTRGQELGAHAGLLLADTKYEFGRTDEGQIVLIDELHTPDSSRWWVTATYEDRLYTGDEPESLDKEVVRRAYVEAGYRGHGEPPALADEVWDTTARRYVVAFERLTGRPFVHGDYPVGDRIATNLREAGLL